MNETRLAILAHHGRSDFELEKVGPWAKFFEVFYLKGIQIVGFREGPNVVVYNNISMRLLPGIFLQSKVTKVLIVWEPSVSNWLNFSRIIRKQFRAVYLFSEKWRLDDNDMICFWPQGELIASEKKIEREDKIVIFCSRKVSLIRDELYSLRTKVIDALGPQIDVFGPGWRDGKLKRMQSLLRRMIHDLPRMSFRASCNSLSSLFFVPHNYFGVVKVKNEVQQNYKYALVIENSLDYISEKLIDAIIAGCIPIYVGPMLEEMGFPEDIAYCVNPRVESVLEAFELLRSNYELQAGILKSGQNFISSRSYANNHVNTKVLYKIAQDLITRID